MTARSVVASMLLLGVTMLVAAGGVVALVGLPVTYESSPAAVHADGLESAGYTETGPEKYAMEDSESVVEISVTNWAAVYHDGGSDSTAEPASLVVLSTPDARLGDRSLNPMTQLSDPELAATALTRLDRFEDDDLTDIRQVDEERRTILGTVATVRTYTATDSGADTDSGSLLVHQAIVEHQGDVVVIVGVHPESTDERETQLSLMEAVEHPLDETGGGVEGLVGLEPRS